MKGFYAIYKVCSQPVDINYFYVRNELRLQCVNMEEGPSHAQLHWGETLGDGGRSAVRGGCEQKKKPKNGADFLKQKPLNEGKSEKVTREAEWDVLTPQKSKNSRQSDAEDAEVTFNTLLLLEFASFYSEPSPFFKITKSRSCLSVIS